MAGIKSLAKDTAIYGLSSIIGRFLNWCLVPLYVYLFPTEEYGIVSYLYSFMAVALVILNYGMETGFFRFANKEEADAGLVYSTSLTSVAVSSAAFMLLLTIFLQPVSDAILLPRHPSYVWLLGVTVAIDAFTNLPFAWLRFKKKSVKFASLKLANVAINIFLNLLFLIILPKAGVSIPDYGIGWIFVANICSTICMLLFLIPDIFCVRWRFDKALWKSMLHYSWPLLILGVAGILSQNMGQMVIPYLFTGQEMEARSMVGIYGANIKIAIVMVMFTQAFRYAYEPFIFAQARNKGEDRTQAYCDAMKFFVIFAFFIFLAVMYFLPILKHFIAPAYWSGLRVVPIMMAAELCFGVYFNLSIWYKLTDRTMWGMWFSLLCFVLMLGLNILFVKAIGIPDGYIGSAWAALASYAAVMVVSWAVGRKYMPIPYQLGKMGLYLLVTAFLFWAGMKCWWENAVWLSYIVRTLLLLLFGAVIFATERPLRR